MTIVDAFRRDESRVLDRLVDGELSQSERRELLAALDDEPGSWRRCALAFLEAQSWRWQLGQMKGDALLAAAAAQNSPRGASVAPHRRGAFWGSLLAIAASLLVAFGLGSRFGNTSQPQLADAASAARPAAPAVDNVAATNPATTPQAFDNDPQAPVAGDEQPEASQEPTWETLTLAMDDGAGKIDPQNKIQVLRRRSQRGRARSGEVAGQRGVALVECAGDPTGRRGLSRHAATALAAGKPVGRAPDGRAGGASRYSAARRRSVLTLHKSHIFLPRVSKRVEPGDSR